MKRYYFRPNEFHDNPVVNMILQKRADGLCEAASGLATVFRIVTDFDIALLYCDKFATPSYLLDESTACMSDYLYHEVVNRFSKNQHGPALITQTTLLWEVNARIVNASGNPARVIRRLTGFYANLDQASVDRINRNYEESNDEIFMLVNRIITKRYYEVYSK